MEISEYVRFLFALCFVLSLIGGLALLAKKMGWTHGMIGNAKPDARLQVVESLSLDTRRRAVIIRRDNVEHLVVLSPTSELLIETNIPHVESDRTPAPDTMELNGPFDIRSKIISGLFGQTGSKG